MECPACGYSLEEKFTVVEKHAAICKENSLVYTMYGCPGCSGEFADPMESAGPEWYSGCREYYGWRWEFGEFLKDVGRLMPDGRILEIGCGEGIVLGKLGDMHNASGIDFNRVAVEKAREKGLKAYPVTIEEFGNLFPGEKFDGVAFFNVLEHMFNPAGFLKSLSNALNGKGLMYLSVPNPSRFGLVFGRENWDYPPHHLVRFSVNGLAKLLNRAGFRILKVKRQPGELPFAEIDRLIKKKMGFDARSVNKVLRNALRLAFFCAYIISDSSAVLKFLLRHRGRKGMTIYMVAQKD